MTAFALQISAGAGPAEVQRFVVQLAARLERLCSERGLAVAEVVSAGDARAARSITLHLRGDAAGLLADQLGSHLLIGRSPARGRASRKRWFAAVTLHAERVAPDARVDVASLPRDALAITACRAGGPGGQHVNKVATAVRVEHLPTGLCVRSAGERSQQANLSRALRRLAALLQERLDATRAGDAAARRQAHHQVVRGRAILTYTLTDDGLILR